MLLKMPVEEPTQSNFWELLEIHVAGAGEMSDNACLTFDTISGWRIPELLRGSTLNGKLSHGAPDLVDSDNWNDDDLGEKKGDWFAEKNAEDDDDISLKVVGKEPNLQLSSPEAILKKMSYILQMPKIMYAL